ncbi:MAG: four-carbon acid sugar kinase family protein, partial [Chitinophagaceae bacterium]
MIEHTLILSYYGDDFTGSTDVMESLTLNGIPTALFLEAPDPEEIRNFRLKNSNAEDKGILQAYGVAGISRSLSPMQMDETLPIVFEKMSRISTKYFHYKICSTFDSSTQVGNIGYAVEIALRYFPSSIIPLIVGIPLLNRFCVFGNLFARVDDTTYRLDRHPTMSKHPVTPMYEADLREHLGKQTNKTIHLIDIEQLQDAEKRRQYYDTYSKEGGYILFDVLKTNDLQLIGKQIEESNSKKTQLLVGSSGVEYALCLNGQQNGSIKKPVIHSKTNKASQYIIIAGSCSPGTALQIEHGLSIGYVGIRINTLNLIENEAAEIQKCTDACLELLNNNCVPILFSAIGPDDPCIESTNIKLKSSGKYNLSIGPLLAGAQGEILKNLIDKTGKLRVTVAGGDTSGFVTKSLGIYALEVLV